MSSSRIFFAGDDTTSHERKNTSHLKHAPLPRLGGAGGSVHLFLGQRITRGARGRGQASRLASEAELKASRPPRRASPIPRGAGAERAPAGGRAEPARRGQPARRRKPPRRNGGSGGTPRAGRSLRRARDSVRGGAERARGSKTRVRVSWGSHYDTPPSDQCSMFTQKKKRRKKCHKMRKKQIVELVILLALFIPKVLLLIGTKN